MPDAAIDRSPLVTRAINIIMHPSTEWARIDAEPASVKGLITGYAVPLALIGPVAGLIGGQLFPMSMFGVVYRTPIVGAVITAVVSYVLSLVAVVVLGLVIDALAPRFGGTSNRVQAMKVAVYSSTASWLAAAFGLMPMLGFLSMVGFYSFYLLFLGLPVLMKAPEEKKVGFTVATVAASLVVYFAISAVIGGIGMMFMTGPAAVSGLAGV